MIRENDLGPKEIDLSKEKLRGFFTFLEEESANKVPYIIISRWRDDGTGLDDIILYNPKYSGDEKSPPQNNP